MSFFLFPLAPGSAGGFASTGEEPPAEPGANGRRHAIITAIACFTLTLAGCGYQLNGSAAPSNSGYQWKSLYREDVHTVAVPAFVNRTYARGVELTLSKAVIQQIELHTQYKVVPADRADTILEGEVVGVRDTPLGFDVRNALPQQQEMTVTVDFTWKNLRTGQIYAQEHGFEQRTTYFPTLGEGDFIGTQDAVEKLAVGIVQTLQADW